MIFVTRLDGKEIAVNDDHVLFAESTPDTVLTFTTGARMMVKEPVEEVIRRVVEYRRRIVSQGPQTPPSEVPVLPDAPTDN